MTDDYRDKSRGTRLQKAMADAGVASRRACEELIVTGRVTINGERIDTLPAWVDPLHDRVEVDGMPIRKPRKGDRHTYVMLHKPKRVISSADDEQGRPTVVDLVDLPGRRLYPVGRLDADSIGLILLTDDGQLAQALTHPSYDVPKRYQVSIKGRLNEEDLARMKKGLYLADRTPGKSRTVGKKTAFDSVRILAHKADRARGDWTLLSITLSEGQNREIRRMLERLGFKVRRLKRVGIGTLRLKGLAAGEWRMLTGAEVMGLYKAAGVEPG